MPNKMLIDASHPEETRVVVTRGNRIEEFDFESQDKKQLKGNIYLARVTRVEPSLQAAFVEYGGNRHGFLAFSEIHPDYYQIPVADRQALLRDEAEAVRAEQEEDDAADERSAGRSRGRRRRGRGGDKVAKAKSSDVVHGEEQSAGDDAEETAEAMAANADAHLVSEPAALDNSDETDIEGDVTRADGDEADDDDAGDADDGGGDNGENGNGREVDVVGAEDALEEVPDRRRSQRRNYKIQEVIKRRQILLVQVVKEERGNKGAALTTYLSLAGRYSVLMPNTARGGGISRKITNVQDRKRLKDVVKDLDVPEGMGVILRTAGANRTKAEIKRDYEYLMRMWENVRTLTLSSSAPALVYEEGSLIKRSVRDLYNKDIGEILVAGEEGYREAKDFMRMLMPSHAKAVQPYREPVPLYVRHGIESQLDKMLQPQVTLKSGGYIIINQTEALVSIDVNSGRSTREHSIEDTALQTNLEAADEVARQLRLRDLAGLVVIDFIDMEEKRNNRSVEKRMKDALRHDRARIQVGRISPFGLLEMSRQRIRSSVLESTMQVCPHCGGTGHIRSESSVALYVLRAIEEYLTKDARHHITVRVPASTALYVLNNKRNNLVELEQRFGLTITVEADETVGIKMVEIDRGPVTDGVPSTATVIAPDFAGELDEELSEEEEDTAERETEARDGGDESDDGAKNRKRRRRRRRRGGRDRDADSVSDETGNESAATGEAEDESVRADGEDGDPEGTERKKRRRGKRGGRRNRRDDETETVETDSGAEAVAEDADSAPAAEMPEVEAESAVAVEETESAVEEPEVAAEPVEEPVKPAPKRRSRAKKVAAEDTAEAVEPASVPAATDDAKAEPADEPAEKPRRARRKPAAKEAEVVSTSEPVVTSVSSSETTDTSDESKPRKAGWWQRKSFF